MHVFSALWLHLKLKFVHQTKISTLKMHHNKDNANGKCNLSLFTVHVSIFETNLQRKLLSTFLLKDKILINKKEYSFDLLFQEKPQFILLSVETYSHKISAEKKVKIRPINCSRNSESGHMMIHQIRRRFQRQAL